MNLGPRARRRAIAALALLVAAVLSWRAFRRIAGDPSGELGARWYAGAEVVDRRGRELRVLPSSAGNRGLEGRLVDMGPRIVTATLASEDWGFYGHDGIDLSAVVRALGQNLVHARRVSGASTITEQLVKLLDHEGRPRPRALGAKIEEAARAENLEEAMNKEAILEAYLNRLGYGHGLTGPEAAARGYFGVSARELSWAQAAYLAVLPRAPSALDPYEHPDRVVVRQRALLDTLHARGVIDDATRARALAEAVVVRPVEHPFAAPHFVEALRARGQLEVTRVTTTLDLDLQRDVEGLVRSQLAVVGPHGATDAAVLVVDNATGEVLAYVGSADYFDARIEGQVDMVRARRQPGSTLKPFVYALAFERGRAGSDLLADVPTSFAGPGGVYAPRDFDGVFLGPVSAREALASSLNVPAVRLAAELPEGALLERLHALGFDSLGPDASRYGVALALGAGEVELRELAEAYVTLARGGERVPLRETLAQPAAIPTRVLDEGAAAEVTEILSDPVARLRVLHGLAPLDPGFAVALKTGTSSGFRDDWTAGYTHERTVVVWIGNADGAPMRGLPGAAGAGPLFVEVMRRAMREVEARGPLWDPALLESAEVCPLSGKRVGSSCPDRVLRRFARGRAPIETCDVHRRASPRPAARAPGEPAWRCDERGTRTVALLPDVFTSWLAHEPSGAGRDVPGVPWLTRATITGCDLDDARTLPELRVDSPAPGSVFVLSRADPAHETIDLRASAAHGDPPPAVELVLDGVVVARTGPPFVARVPATPGDHELLARPVDPRARVRLVPSRFSVR